MQRRFVLLVTLVAGCSDPQGKPPQDPATTPDPPPTTTTDPPPTTTTTTAPPAPQADVLTASCAFDVDNPLRGTCGLTLSDRAIAELVLSDGTETVVFRTTDASAAPTIPFWGLHAEATWTWTARAGGVEQTGELIPPALPAAMDLRPVLTGAGATFTQVLVPTDCGGGGYVTVLDDRGRVRWFQDTLGRDVDMTYFSAGSGTIAFIYDKEGVAEVAVTGAEGFRREDFGVPVHHDVFVRDDLVYTLLAQAWEYEDGSTYVEDVVVALDHSGTEVWRWDQHDHLDATLAGRPPGGFWEWRFGEEAVDAWHTNGVYVTPELDLIVSIKTQNTLLRISRVDGSTQWVLAGNGIGRAFPTTFTTDDPVATTFSNQHHPAMLDNGHVTVFDNQHLRGLELALDESAGTVSFVADWDLTPMDCPVQSSVFPMANAHALLTCGDDAEVVEFDDAGAEIWRMELGCERAVVPRAARGQPMDLWGAITSGGATATREP